VYFIELLVSQVHDFLIYAIQLVVVFDQYATALVYHGIYRDIHRTFLPPPTIGIILAAYIHEHFGRFVLSYQLYIAVLWQFLVEIYFLDKIRNTMLKDVLQTLRQKLLVILYFLDVFFAKRHYVDVHSHILNIDVMMIIVSRVVVTIGHVMAVVVVALMGMLLAHVFIMTDLDIVVRYIGLWLRTFLIMYVYFHVPPQTA
jgi:hypothetical protein